MITMTQLTEEAEFNELFDNGKLVLLNAPAADTAPDRLDTDTPEEYLQKLKIWAKSIESNKYNEDHLEAFNNYVKENKPTNTLKPYTKKENEIYFKTEASKPKLVDLTLEEYKIKHNIPLNNQERVLTDDEIIQLKQNKEEYDRKMDKETYEKYFGGEKFRGKFGGKIWREKFGGEKFGGKNLDGKK